MIRILEVDMFDMMLCSYCNKIFETRQRLQKHLSRFHKQVSEINESSPSEQISTENSDIMSTQKEYAHEETMKTIQVHVKENLKCPYCKRTFDQRSFLTNHISFKHAIGLQKENLNNTEILETSNCYKQISTLNIEKSTFEENVYEKTVQKYRVLDKENSQPKTHVSVLLYQLTVH